MSQPFKRQCTQTNSPNLYPYISLKILLREFDKPSNHFLFGDYFIHSHREARAGVAGGGEGWGRNCIVGNLKVVNDIISHKRGSKVLTSQSRHAARRNLFSFVVDSPDYTLTVLQVYTLDYSLMF